MKALFRDNSCLANEVNIDVFVKMATVVTLFLFFLLNENKKQLNNGKPN